MSSTPKAEETGRRILDSALELFRQEGFDTATMRDVARKAGVATGAAYYYYPSKDAIVMDFYRRACEEMQPRLQAALEPPASLEIKLRELIRVKLDYFGPDRGILRALLRNGADPKHPLSPFSPQTREIREIDIAWFRRILVDCGMRIPRDIEPHLPGVLWFLQMGVIFFWAHEVRPYFCWKSRISLMKRCAVVGEDVMDAVSSEPSATKVPEYRSFGIDRCRRK